MASAVLGTTGLAGLGLVSASLANADPLDLGIPAVTPPVSTGCPTPLASALASPLLTPLPTPTPSDTPSAAPSLPTSLSCSGSADTGINSVLGVPTPTPSSTNNGGGGGNRSGGGNNGSGGQNGGSGLTGGLNGNTSSLFGLLPSSTHTNGTQPQGDLALFGSWVNAFPSLAARTGAILQAPIAPQPPDLEHLPGVTGSTDAGGGGPTGVDLHDVSSSAGGGATSGLLIGGIVVGLAIALLLFRRFWFTRSHRIIPVITIGVALCAGALGGLALTHQQAGRSSVATAPAIAAAAPVNTDARSIHGLTAARVVAGLSHWSALNQIETTIAVEHDALAGNESQITSVTQEIEIASPSAAAPPVSETASRSSQRDSSPQLRPQSVSSLAKELDTLTAEHDALATAYQQALKNEYDFYVQAVQQPKLHDALEAVIAQQPADVQTAVQYDLGVVQAQVDQEAAIAAAQAAAQASATQDAPAPTLHLHATGVAPTQLRVPVDGVLTQPFGATDFAMEAPMTYNGVFYPHFHTGLDIAAVLDSPVGAAADGTVIFAGSSLDSAGHLVGYGNYIVIEHAGGLLTLYGHLDKIAVNVGDKVASGQVIGLLGSTGFSTGPHVHFEVRLGGVVIDPAPYLGTQIHAATS
ncbi:MAG: M23 family metallopeptidase [Candidatus Dormibacteraeota bacterium]|nr:M23 family metallopeptidase [Candidatus Dormibacteraeota bacterium]